MLRPIADAELPAGEEPTVLTLYKVRWFSAAGVLGLRDLPAVRIPLWAVTAWWIVGGAAIAGPTTEAEKRTWFAGIMFPLG
jgi:hypothetical protein